MSQEKGGGLKRWIPVVKIAVAAGLIAFLLWLVPIRDHLFIPAADESADRAFVGSIESRDDSSAVFVSDDGERVQLVLDKDELKSAVLADGTTLLPAVVDKRDSARQARLEPGMVTTLANMSLPHMLGALVLMFLGSLIAVYRWHLLLRAADLGIPFGRAFSLTYIGTFFNNVMPGLTGGDLVKAFYIAKDHPRQKTEAIITVLLDRVLGLTGLALVAACVILVDLEQYAEVAPWIYGVLAAEAAFGCVFFSRRVRKRLGVDALLARLPFKELVTKIDQAVFMYRYRGKLLLLAAVLSMVVHMFIITAIGVIGVGLGLRLGFLSYYAVVPIGLIASAIPIAPAGLGVTEATLVYFMATVGVTKTRALSLSLLQRMSQLVISLIGGVCLARFKGRASAEEMSAFAESDDGAVPGGPSSGAQDGDSAATSEGPLGDASAEPGPSPGG